MPLKKRFDLDPIDEQIWSKLNLRDYLHVLQRAATLARTNASPASGNASLLKGDENQDNANSAENQRAHRDESDHQRPESHALLGGKIVLSALAVFCGLWVIVLSFNHAHQAAQAFRDRWVFGWALIAIGGASLPTAALFYWLGALSG
ncbi:hypothetical protein [Sphingomonas sp.]|uniref:hypothetical protein n=1 Tax=Sphingomonas sp. TaxID=28214 RepID=UPI0017ABEDCD|nr:hypothetical protein [Sphingomonas sp.]MBA3512387.1 hypothetical protein [Sphingomonas sp.]